MAFSTPSVGEEREGGKDGGEGNPPFTASLPWKDLGRSPISSGFAPFVFSSSAFLLRTFFAEGGCCSPCAILHFWSLLLTRLRVRGGDPDSSRADVRGDQVGNIRWSNINRGV